MEHRALEFYQFSDLNRTSADGVRRLHNGDIDVDYYVARAHTQRATAAITALKAAGRAVARLFS